MTETTCPRLIAAAFVAFTLPFAATQAIAAGSHGGGHGHAVHGEPGDPAKASRTVTVEMDDNYYGPERIAVKAGETVRFTVTNAGGFVHEFNIGTPEMHAAHQDEMAMMVEHGVLLPDRIDQAAAAAMQASMGHGQHDDPNSVLLEPGQTAEVVWTFPQEGVIEFACNVPGHYDAGMAGRFDFVETLAQH